MKKSDMKLMFTRVRENDVITHEVYRGTMTTYISRRYFFLTIVIPITYRYFRNNSKFIKNIHFIESTKKYTKKY